MKNNTIYEKQYRKQPLYQSGYNHNLPPTRTNSSSADFSLDKHFRRTSPAPQERFSHAPNHLLYSIPTYPTHDYQLHPKNNELYPPSPHPDHTKLIKDLLQRVEKLQSKGERWEKFQQRVQRLQGNTLKMATLMETTESRKEECLKGKENTINNTSTRKEEEFRAKVKDYVTKDELQKHLTGLDSAFKSLFTSFRTSINAEVGDYNMKNKKKFIQITANQLSQKLEQFKGNFLKEWTGQIQNIVKETWSNELVGKSVLGLSREKFIGNTIPVKVKEQLTVLVEGASKEVMTLETMYYLDQEGFLLDSEMHYLLNQNGKQIQLEQSLIDKLKIEGLLNTPTQPKEKEEELPLPPLE